MSDLKLISILVFILLNFLLSIAHPLDGNEEFQELSAPEISTCPQFETNNQLNAIIINKVRKILELDAIEKRKILQMKKSRNKKLKLKSKSKSQKSSGHRSVGKIQNQIFVQFFDRNQTSVEINRQPFKNENENVPQTPPKIDIGKLNWTDASFDKNLRAIDYASITASELKKILDEIMKHSKCPLGSFYDSEKGCLSIRTLEAVPEIENAVDIEGIFNQPLTQAEIQSVDGKISEVETKSPEAENANSELQIIPENEKFTPTNVEMEMGKHNRGDSTDMSIRLLPNANELKGMGDGELSMTLSNNLSNKHKTLIDESEIPMLMSIKSKLLEPAIDMAYSGKMQITAAPPTENYPFKMEMNSGPSGVEMDMGESKIKLNGNPIVTRVSSVTTTTTTTPSNIILSFPEKIIEKTPRGSLSMNFRQPFPGGGNSEMTMNVPHLEQEFENAFITFGDNGKAVGEKLANLSLDDKSPEQSEVYEEESTTEPKKRLKQAYFVHQVPLIASGLKRKSSDVEKSPEPQATKVTDAPITAVTGNPTETMSTSTSSKPTETTAPPKVFPMQTGKIIPSLVNAVKESIDVKKNFFKNVWPGMFNDQPDQLNDAESEGSNRRFVTPAVTFQSVQGKTMSDDVEEITEALNLKPKNEHQATTLKPSEQTTAEKLVKPLMPTKKIDAMTSTTEIPSTKTFATSLSKSSE